MVYLQRQPLGRPFRSRCWAGTSAVSLLIHGRYRARSPQTRACRYTTLGAGSGLRRGGARFGSCLRCSGWPFNNRSHDSWANKHAEPRFTVEISLSLYRPIVLPRVIVQFDANPFSIREARSSHVPDGGLPTVGKRDNTAGGEFGHVDRVKSELLREQWRRKESPRRCKEGQEVGIGGCSIIVVV